MKTLTKLALAAGLALALSGCKPSQKYQGEFRGNDVSVVMSSGGNKRSIIIYTKSQAGYDIHMLSAVDLGEGFTRINLDGQSLERFQEYVENQGRDFSYYPLFKYANPDSLNVAFEEIVKNGRKIERVY